MLILKVEMKDLELVGGITQFIKEVFLKRNWDVFLTLVLKVNKEEFEMLITKNNNLKEISQKIDLRFEMSDEQSPKQYEVIKFDSKLDYSLIDDSLQNTLDFDKGLGLIPTIVQDQNNTVLMLGYSSEESLKQAISTRRGVYFSRSRNKLWVKGEESGNCQELKRILFDCDADSLLFIVEQTGFACHTGKYSCFQDKKFTCNYLYQIITDRIKNSKIDESYTKKLSENYDLLIAKIREESNEVISHTDRENLIWEIADLTYFVLVLMAVKNVSPEEVLYELRRRNK